MWRISINFSFHILSLMSIRPVSQVRAGAGVLCGTWRMSLTNHLWRLFSLFRSLLIFESRCCTSATGLGWCTPPTRSSLSPNLLQSQSSSRWQCWPLQCKLLLFSPLLLQLFWRQILRDSFPSSPWIPLHLGKPRLKFRQSYPLFGTFLDLDILSMP